MTQEQVADAKRTTLVAMLRYIGQTNPYCQDAADEIERLANKVYSLEVDLREAEANVDIQRELREAYLKLLGKTNHR